MTKYGDLYEIVNPSLDLVSLCVITGEECAKGLVFVQKGQYIKIFFIYIQAYLWCFDTVFGDHTDVFQ